MIAPKNLLLIRTDRIGDVILSLPLAELVKRHFPNCKVTYLLRNYTKCLAQNHPFIDGNKRIGHAAMETFLMLNGHEISASVDEQADIILDVASGKVDRHAFTNWLKGHIVDLS